MDIHVVKMQHFKEMLHKLIILAMEVYYTGRLIKCCVLTTVWKYCVDLAQNNRETPELSILVTFT